MKKLLASLLTISLFACSTPILNNTNQYSDLDKEYSQFKTEALTQSYLKKKMDKWLSDDKYTKNLIREIEYAKFKHKDLLKDIVALQTSLFTSITANTGVINKRNETTFDNYINYIDPFSHPINYAIGSIATASSSWRSPVSGLTIENGGGWNSGGFAPAYAIFDLSTQKNISRFTILTSSSPYAWANFDIDGSNDGTTFTNIVSGSAYHGQFAEYNVTPVDYRYIRIYCTSWGPSWVSIDFFGIYK